jgi:hypothetical protein
MIWWLCQNFCAYRDVLAILGCIISHSEKKRETLYCSLELVPIIFCVVTLLQNCWNDFAPTFAQDASPPVSPQRRGGHSSGTADQRCIAINGAAIAMAQRCSHGPGDFTPVSPQRRGHDLDRFGAEHADVTNSAVFSGSHIVLNFDSPRMWRKECGRRVCRWRFHSHVCSSRPLDASRCNENRGRSWK